MNRRMSNKEFRIPKVVSLLLWAVALVACALAPAGSGVEEYESAFVGVLIALSIASAAYSAYASYQASSAMADQAEANADYNAEALENQAKQEQYDRGAEETEERKQARKARARMEAIYAKSGVLLTGTPADALVDQAGVDEFNILEGNRASAIRQAGGLSRADMVRAQGASRADAYNTAANTAVISGLGKGALSAISAYLDYGTPAKTENVLQTKTPDIAMNTRNPFPQNEMYNLTGVV